MCNVYLQHGTELEQVIRELQRSRVNLSDRLTQQKQQLIHVCGTSYVLDSDFINLQDTKDRVRSTSNVLHYITTYINILPISVSVKHVSHCLCYAGVLYLAVS